MKKNSTAAQGLTVVTGNHHYVKGHLLNDSIRNRLSDIEKDIIVEKLKEWHIELEDNKPEKRTPWKEQI